MRYRAVLAWRSPPRFRRCRTVLPEEASIGEAPHSIEKAASERSRAGSSPAVTSSAPATSAPTPHSSRNAGAALAVSRSSSASSVVSSAVSANCRSATVRSASLVAAVGVTIAPGAQPRRRGGKLAGVKRVARSLRARRPAPWTLRAADPGRPGRGFNKSGACVARLVAVLSAHSAGMSHPPLPGRETAITTIAHAEPIRVTVGVDTHGDIHVAYATDQLGRHLATTRVATTPRGYRALLDWARGLGQVAAFGVE